MRYQVITWTWDEGHDEQREFSTLTQARAAAREKPGRNYTGSPEHCGLIVQYFLGMVGDNHCTLGGSGFALRYLAVLGDGASDTQSAVVDVLPSQTAQFAAA